MSEVVVLTSTKDSGGIVVIDTQSGAQACPAFKNCIAEPGNLCFIGNSQSAFSGAGSAGDYIVSSQSKKTVMNIYQWNKPHAIMQCHTQEILSAIASDSQGLYLVGGSKRGWVYVWSILSGELIRSFQAHFKAVSRITFDPLTLFCITAAEDGMVRVWEMTAMVEFSDGSSSINKKKSLTPFR
jgi:pre-rRNA-processing protein IPI3